MSDFETRIENGIGYRVQELQIPLDDWMVINELARDIPDELRHADESRALDWLEARGSEYSYVLSPKIHEAINSVIQGSDTSVLLLATEDPGNLVGPTPLDHLTPAENKLFQPDFCRGILIGAFGLHGYGYTSQQHGVIFNNMVVAESQRDIPLVASSTGALGFHTEDSAFADGDDGGMSPDILSLHYFRNIERVSTPVSVLNVELLYDELIEELRKPQFFIPNSNAQGGTLNQTDQKVAVLYGDNDRPNMRFNAALMPLVPDAQGPEAMAAIKAFSTHLKQQTTTLILKPGDILFVNNRQAAHSKGKHDWEAPAGQGRWQRRLALTRDLGRISRYTEDDKRIVNPDKYKALVSL